MTPQEIAQAAESISLTPWHIAAEAAAKFMDAEIGSRVGFGWNALQSHDSAEARIRAPRRVLFDLGWHSDPWELNRTEIATIILEKVFGK